MDGTGTISTAVRTSRSSRNGRYGSGDYSSTAAAAACSKCYQRNFQPTWRVPWMMPRLRRQPMRWQQEKSMRGVLPCSPWRETPAHLSLPHHPRLLQLRLMSRSFKRLQTAPRPLRPSHSPRSSVTSELQVQWFQLSLAVELALARFHKKRWHPRCAVHGRNACHVVDAFAHSRVAHVHVHPFT